MKDFFGTTLRVGDTVACITRHYRDFTLGKIVNFTPKQVRVEHPDGYRGTETTLRYPSVLVKKPE